jgi:protein-S-isoprenylcysteine O-methyltransferase Ste14
MGNSGKSVPLSKTSCSGWEEHFHRNSRFEMEIVITKPLYMMKHKRDITPLILSILLILGIVILAFLRHWFGIGAWVKWPVDVDLIFAGLYVVWILVEFKIAQKDAITEGKQTLDFGTCELYALGQACTILTALWFPSIWHAHAAVHFWGILIFLCGVLYRLWAIRTLGQFYSHRVRKVSQHQILNSGPYRFIRHPAYAGMIIANVGLTLYFFNWVTLAVFLVVLVPSVVLRILVEERMLFEIEGYSNFAKKRKRLIPAIW